jgi:hypothetical protein
VIGLLKSRIARGDRIGSGQFPHGVSPMAALPAQSFRLPEIQLAEILSGLSHALDMVEGQPPGHCARCCWIGIHIGWEIGLNAAEIWELYYTLLLKDLGCSSNAARIC